MDILTWVMAKAMCSNSGDNSGGNSGGGEEEWIGDGNTHIWITLPEGRTSPVLGVCPNGTVTVDWGDGTTPDILTGTSVTAVKYTPNHAYAKPGDYVITLTVDGKMGISGNSSGPCILRNAAGADIGRYGYYITIKKVEIGNCVTRLETNSFRDCYALESVNVSGSVTSIGGEAFYYCYSLKSVNISDGVTRIYSNAFSDCYSLKSVNIPGSVMSIGSNAFSRCYSLTSVNIPDGVTSIDMSAFYYCNSLKSVNIPGSVTSIGNSAFAGCYTLPSINIPDGVTGIEDHAFRNCYSSESVNVSGSVTSIGSYAFAGNVVVRYYDFTKHTVVPTLAATNAFNSIAPDCEIRVPAALYDEWIAATNWTAYANYIKAV